VSNDRYVRLHSTCPAPAEAGKRQEEKVPKAEKQGRDGEESDEEEAEDVWDEMEDIGEVDSDADEGTRRVGKKVKNRKT
jgi:hypothetical protein